MTHQFIIDCRLPSLNEYINAERTDKYKAAKIKKEATETCYWFAKSIAKQVDWNLRYDIHFDWHCGNKKNDPDGICSFAKKVALDGMVKAHLLAGDSPKHVGNFRDTFHYGKKWFVVVTMVETDPL